MSDSVWPHRWQPTRVPCPWDSPGKNTTVGCHFLPQCMKVKSESEVAQSCLTLRDPMDCSLPGSSIHGIFQARVLAAASAAAKLLQSCPTLCDLIDGSPPGSPVSGIFLGKNTGVGCHFLLQCMKVKSESEVAQSCQTSRPHGLQPTRLLRSWDLPGKSTGMGCHSLPHNSTGKYG